jgi:aryl-alcohol dehydrogenase-like predicted oxidoreductase
MRKFHKVLTGEGFMLASNQVRYSLIQRKIETNGILDTARELGITIIAYSPLAQGVLTGRFHDDPTLALKVSFGRRMMSGITRAGLKKTEPLVRYLQETGRKYSAAGVAASATQVALNWLVNFNGDTVVAIPGASKAKQATEAAHCLDFTLRPEEIKEIEALSRK